MATIVSIAQHTDPTYPIRVNRLEMLPLWTRISRVTDDSNDPCSSKFYRLSSCDLIDGTVEVEFQESAFSRGISEALAASGLARETTSVSSVAVVTPTVTQGSPSERTTQVGSSVDMGPENRRLSGAVEQAKSSISRDDHAAIADKLSVFETLLTEDQRRKQQHRPIGAEATIQAQTPPKAA